MNMKEETQVKYCLTIADKAKAFIKNEEAKTLIDAAINTCQEWLNSKHDVSERLYDFLDNEENGFTVFQECETDEKAIAAQDCIIDAIAFVCKQVYLEAGKKYFPEPIELVGDGTIDHMMESFLLCNGGNGFKESEEER